MKKTSIAKISRPNAKGIIPRKRLFRLLDNPGKQPIFWVAGPAGSGKTSLVAGYLDARKLPCIWYQIDERDSDIASFFYYLGTAANKAAPRHRKPFPLLTPEYLGGIETFTLRFFENLYGRLKPPFAVVFENYQDVGPDALLHSVMSVALSHVPEGIQVIILSRNEPFAAFSRLRARDAVRIIGWDDLRFTLDETKQFLKRKVKLNDAAVEELHTKTEGWAGGLVLLSETAQIHAEGTFPEESPARAEVFDYFAGEVLDKLAPETQDFLMMSSLLPQMTVQTAIELTDCDNAAAILSGLNRNNFFTEKRSAPDLTYRYHSLFRDFLLARMKRSLSTEGLLRVQKRAATVLLKEGQVEDAIGLLSAARDWNGLAVIILENAQQLVSQGKNRTLQEWIERLPRETVDSSPWLIYWYAISLAPFNPIESRKSLETAFELFKKEGIHEGQLLACLSIMDSYAISMGEFGGADRWISELEGIFKRSMSFPSSELEIRATFAMFTILYLARPDHPRLPFWLERAKSLMSSCRDSSQRVINATFLFIYYAITGSLAETRFLINDLHRAMKSPDVPPVIRILGCLMRAVHGWSTASFDACHKAVAEGLETARFHGLQSYEWKLYTEELFCTTITGNCEASSELLQKLAAATNFDSRFQGHVYHLLASFDARCRDDFSLSLEHARLSEKLAAACGHTFAHTLTLFDLSQALYHTGNIPKARECTEKALKVARLIKSRLIEFSCLLMKALFEFSEKSASSDAKGLAVLRRALSLAREHTMMNILGWHRKTLAGLCARALDAGIEPEFTLKLIKVHGLEPEDSTVVSETWPWPLRITTLGRFEVLKDGKRAGTGRKVQHKPLLLLKALIALGGSEVPEEKITDLLWPDSEGDAAHSAFSTTLQRLRALIGNEEALLLNGRRLTLDHRYCWVDAWSFERMHERAESLWRGVPDQSDANRSNAAAEAYRQGVKAQELYQGSFLPGDSGEAWTAAYRERLRSKFLRLVLRQGLYLEESSQWQKAAETFQQGLEIDELAEEFYQRLMVCHQKQGQKAEAIRVYDACRAVLSTTLGIAPSQQTEALYASLLK